jgi:UPF0755 protein
LVKLSSQLLKVLIILVLALVIIFFLQRTISHFLNGASAGNQRVLFIVNKDETVDEVAKKLKDDNLIQSATYFKFKIRLTNADADLKAGRFTLHHGMTVDQIIHAITTSEDVETVKVRFQEGWRTEQYAERLQQLGLISSTDELMYAIKNGQWNYTFLNSRPSDATLEGFLFPDTYEFRAGGSTEDIINTLLQTFDQKVPANMRAKTNALGYNFYQVMTVASIVEREAVVPSERPVIASVYYNRVKAGMPLQADPTVQYALGHPGDWWPQITQDDLNTDDPYNTYLHPGLPGPICNPSLASIQAALNPAQTDYLYFVAKGDGSGAHDFSKTYAEQQGNINKDQ